MQRYTPILLFSSIKLRVSPSTLSAVFSSKLYTFSLCVTSSTHRPFASLFNPVNALSPSLHLDMQNSTNQMDDFTAMPSLALDGQDFSHDDDFANEMGIWPAFSPPFGGAGVG